MSEGKSDAIYNAHSYHTKVPPKAIMRYILHYTNPGDIVFDGFCGSGMTGVAAQACGEPEPDFKTQIELESKKGGADAPQWGARRAILSDLSTSATFITSNHTLPNDPDLFEAESAKLLKDFETGCGWMYVTRDPESGKQGTVNYTVWAELFTCPHCAAETNYFAIAVDPNTSQVQSDLKCPNCKAAVDKKALDRVWETHFDPDLKRNHKLVRYAPVLINYQIGDTRREKVPDSEDHTLLQKIQATTPNHWYPFDEMPEGERKGKDGYHLKGISHLHHFYFKRALIAYSWLRSSAQTCSTFTQFYVQGSALGFTKMNRYSANHFSQTNRYFSGTLYVGSLISEVSPRYSMTHKRERLAKLSIPARKGNVIITAQSSTQLKAIPDNCVDYVFIDPPFGNNLHYSELNFIWEAWLRLYRQREPEAVMDNQRDRTLAFYQRLMTDAFNEIFRILKQGRWMTVEFHNSKNSVWNAIQQGLLHAGFVVADVRTLDKQCETYKQSIQKLVKQDLIISAYKPSAELEKRFALKAGTVAGVWDFINSHLAQLPLFSTRENFAQIIAERQQHLLYDRMVAFHIVRSVLIPVTAGEFFVQLAERYPERNGMFFLPEQVNEYDRKLQRVEGVEQFELFIDGEATAIQWLRRILIDKPQLLQDLTPVLMQELASWKKHEKPLELKELLELNFLCYDGTGDVPSQIHSYLSTQFKELRNLPKDHAQLKAKGKNRWYVPDPRKNVDVETLRNKRLLEEFWSYLPEGYTPPALSANKGQTLPGLTVPRPKIPKGKKLKELRTEAVRVGFKHCYQQKDYTTILVVADMIPDSVLNEDEQLQMIYDTAVTRTSGGGEV